MKKIRFAVIGILSLIAFNSCKPQIIVQTWVDPCTNTVQTATFPLNGPGVLVMYRGASRVFTAQQAQAGELQA